MRNYEIVVYVKKDGEKPVKNFIKSLDEKMQAKIVHVINLVAEKGIRLREPYSKHLGDGIFELRAKVGSDISRVLYFFTTLQLFDKIKIA